MCISFSSFRVFIYVQYFFDVVGNQTSNKKYLLESIKGRSKVRKMNMPREFGLSFD